MSLNTGRPISRRPHAQRSPNRPGPTKDHRPPALSPAPETDRPPPRPNLKEEPERAGRPTDKPAAHVPLPSIHNVKEQPEPKPGPNNLMGPNAHDKAQKPRPHKTCPGECRNGYPEIGPDQNPAPRRQNPIYCAAATTSSPNPQRPNRPSRNPTRRNERLNGAAPKLSKS